MGRKGIGAALMALVVACSSGCGSSQPLTRAQFLTKVDAICRKGHVQVAAIFRAASSQPQATTRARWFASLRSMAHELEQIRAPTSLRLKYTAYTKALRTQFTLMESDATAHSRAAMARQEAATHTATRLAQQLRLGRYC